ncbi:MAG: spermidine/putrescine ABC transporter permease [Actinobacteria bacterium RBG_16_68_21]|nr:MAG: spermidine/putrescine ABC transporter permease [Actinobacteria bacterium RBG_16_68_21]
MVTEQTTRGPIDRISGALHHRPRLRLALLLGLPLLWLVGVYGGSLLALLSQSFFSIDDFSGTIDRTLTLDTWGDLFTDSNISIAIRTTVMATAVTIAAAIVAFPIAYYAVRFAGRRLRAVFFVLILIPLWSSYLVRVYSWKLILAREGILFWFVDKLGLNFLLDAALSAPGIGGPSLSASALGQFIVFVYIWLPYMILPVHAALERVPTSYLEASADLGARPLQTFRTVIWPLAIPGIAAGSIFTFSLTLGDYIIPTIIGDSTPFVGLAIYSYQGVAGNLPLAAAFTFFPIVIMGVYLYVARRVGAFEAL